MTRLAPDLYLRWRTASTAPASFRDTPEPPPEKWLQQIWRHQRLLRDRLATLDGRRLRVLHPGFWNREAGPDFRQTVLQFDGNAPVSGDVELDLEVNGWRGHRHATNPAYANVILHIVWDAVPADLAPPVLVLKPFLDAPLSELAPWLEHEAHRQLPDLMLGKCCHPLRGLPDDAVMELLNQAALVRLRTKAQLVAGRSRHVGWEQSLREACFAALGFKHNAWPMRQLAELIAGLPSGPPDEWEARLLGLAGLLPTQPAHPGATAQHLRRLWDFWWRERDRWVDQILPSSMWRMAGIRPANHPQRRLALAARWLAGPPWEERLEGWARTKLQRCGNADEILPLLVPEHGLNSFWDHHWTLRSRTSERVCPLLGPGRTNEIIVNAILPWLWARAEFKADSEGLSSLESRFVSWPAGQDNALLRQARSRLLGQPSRRLPRTAGIQQGLLQILRDFCDASGPLCLDCRFPTLVGNLLAGEATPAPV